MKRVEINTLLVPVDFSDNSKGAFERAICLASGENPVVILLHVIDSALPKFAESHDLGSHQQITERMRQRAEQLLKEYTELCPKHIELDLIISEGRPFLEILQKARDFVVDAIVMSKTGNGTNFDNIEGLLFGSTAEKVLRGSKVPVFVVPPLH